MVTIGWSEAHIQPLYLLKTQFAYKWIGLKQTYENRGKNANWTQKTTYKRRRNKSFNRPFILFVMHHKSITVWSIDFNLTKNINKKEKKSRINGNSSDKQP